MPPHPKRAASGALAPPGRSRVDWAMLLYTALTAAQAADTVVMVQVRDGLGTAAAVAQVALATVFVLILGALLLLLLQLRRIHVTVRELAGRLENRAAPMIDRGKEVAANVEFISGAVRTDVQHVSETLRSMTRRLQEASDRMERRVEDFNALMEVVQSEAEDIFVGSAATVRGMRAGARALRVREEEERAAPVEESATAPHD